MHRDIKGANVFMHEEGGVTTCQLGDFGIGRAMNSGTNTAKTFAGTYHYTSPEMYDDVPYGYAADIWSLGCVLYEMCALFCPFSGTSMAQISRQVLMKQPTRIPGQFSDQIWQICCDMLVKDSKKRITIDQILKRPIIVQNAQNFLQHSVFIAEFPDSGVVVQPEAVPERKLAQKVKPDPALPVDAVAGGTCTRHLYKAEDASLGAAHTAKVNDQ